MEFNKVATFLSGTFSWISSSAHLASGATHLSSRIGQLLSRSSGHGLTVPEQRVLLVIERQIDSLVHPLQYCVFWARHRSSAIHSTVHHVQEILLSVCTFIQPFLDGSLLQHSTSEDQSVSRVFTSSRVAPTRHAATGPLSSVGSSVPGVPGGRGHVYEDLLYCSSELGVACTLLNTALNFIHFVERPCPSCLEREAGGYPLVSCQREWDLPFSAGQEDARRRIFSNSAALNNMGASEINRNQADIQMRDSEEGSSFSRSGGDGGGNATETHSRTNPGENPPSLRQPYLDTKDADGLFLHDAGSACERVRDTPCLGRYPGHTEPIGSASFSMVDRRASSSLWPPLLGCVAGVPHPLRQTRFSPAALLRASRKLQEAQCATPRGGDLCMSVGRLYFRVITQTLLPSSLLHSSSSSVGPSFSTASPSGFCPGVPGQDAGASSWTYPAPCIEGKSQYLDGQDGDPTDLERFYVNPMSLNSGRVESSLHPSYSPPTHPGAYPGMVLGNGSWTSPEDTLKRSCHFGSPADETSPYAYPGNTGRLGAEGVRGSGAGSGGHCAPRQWVTGSISDWSLLHPVALLRIVKNTNEGSTFRTGAAGPWTGAGNGARQSHTTERTTSLCVESLHLHEKSSGSTPAGSGRGTGQWGETSFLPAGQPSGAFPHFGGKGPGGAGLGGVTEGGGASALGGRLPCVSVSEPGARGTGELSAEAAFERGPGPWNVLSGFEHAGSTAEGVPARRLDGDNPVGEGSLYGFSVSMGMYQADEDGGHDSDIVYVPDPEQIDEALLGLPALKIGETATPHTMSYPSRHVDSLQNRQENYTIHGTGRRDRIHVVAHGNNDCEHHPIHACMQNKPQCSETQPGRTETGSGWSDGSQGPPSSSLTGAYQERLGDCDTAEGYRRGGDAGVSVPMGLEVQGNGKWEPMTQRPWVQERRFKGGSASGLEETAFPSSLGNSGQVPSAPPCCQTSYHAQPSRSPRTAKAACTPLVSSESTFAESPVADRRRAYAVSGSASEAGFDRVTITAGKLHDERETQFLSLYSRPQESSTRSAQASFLEHARSCVSGSSAITGLTGQERKISSNPYSLLPSHPLPESTSSACWPTDCRYGASNGEHDEPRPLLSCDSVKHQSLELREYGCWRGISGNSHCHTQSTPPSFPPLILSRKMPAFLPPALAAAISCRRLSFPTTVCLGARLTSQSRLGLPIPSALPPLPADHSAANARGGGSNTLGTRKRWGQGRQPSHAVRPFVPSPDMACLVWSWKFPAAHAVPLRATGLLSQLERRLAYLRHHRTVNSCQCCHGKHEPGTCEEHLRSSAQMQEEQETGGCRFAQSPSRGGVPSERGGEAASEGGIKWSGHTAGRNGDEETESFPTEQKREEQRPTGQPATPVDGQRKAFVCGLDETQQDAGERSSIDDEKTIRGEQGKARYRKKKANLSQGLLRKDEYWGNTPDSSSSESRLVTSLEVGGRLPDPLKSSRGDSSGSYFGKKEGTETNCCSQTTNSRASWTSLLHSEVSGRSGEQSTGSDVEGLIPLKAVESATLHVSKVSPVSACGSDTPLGPTKKRGKRRKDRQETGPMLDRMSPPQGGSDNESKHIQSFMKNMDTKIESASSVTLKRSSDVKEEGIPPSGNLDESNDHSGSQETPHPARCVEDTNAWTPQEPGKGKGGSAHTSVSPGTDVTDMFPSSGSVCYGEEVMTIISGSPGEDRTYTAGRNSTAVPVAFVESDDPSVGETAQGREKEQPEGTMRGGGGQGHDSGSNNFSKNGSSSVSLEKCHARHGKGRHEYQSPHTHRRQMHHDPSCPGHERILRATCPNRQREVVFPEEHIRLNVPVLPLPDFNGDTLVQQRFLVHYAFLFDPGALDSDPHSIAHSGTTNTRRHGRDGLGGMRSSEDQLSALEFLYFARLCVIDGGLDANNGGEHRDGDATAGELRNGLLQAGHTEATDELLAELLKNVFLDTS
ncbi:hypothetical protein TGME49_257360 [Toxoplasma gondii ME49]|uniref:Uncharacterized protein n=2 Tax=Toxoplasma gondii TaxID=5811 RepID=A0A0F7UZX7_TOXGV|nr:hypothetical protein TGME49_257360 [Toxoplasma gondii ME49]EPT29255.1 hypothetical protein TGME49_257360 [Toxoplasma gondii ME49]ESS28602.1 hypothetical protein TGVEG_257360 [Toxoplasma gondii VEG]CEL74559.1 TPA: hypothetical protein BN1205_077190 [Toxoplasma gondii VEG]|eukprot:XP_018636972.1 hypothetical protein TGME49_257360 [Toxoplasma gondii ME49]